MIKKNALPIKTRVNTVKLAIPTEKLQAEVVKNPIMAIALEKMGCGYGNIKTVIQKNGVPIQPVLQIAKPGTKMAKKLPKE